MGAHLLVLTHQAASDASLLGASVRPTCHYLHPREPSPSVLHLPGFPWQVSILESPPESLPKLTCLGPLPLLS